MADAASLRFYLYGTYAEGRDTLPKRPFTFVLDLERPIDTPSFLIWIYREAGDGALLCKIRRTTRPADLGTKIHVYDVTPIRVLADGLLNSVYSEFLRVLGVSAREHASDMLLMRDFYAIPDDKTSLVKNVILKQNPGVVDESYFHFGRREDDSEVAIELRDALFTGARIFGMPLHSLPNLREQQILDFDVATLFSDAKRLDVLPDGKHVFEYRGRRLYIQKVDRTSIEECLGVDLIYNFYDESRLVFVQYKCQRAKGKYYPASDDSHNSEIERMTDIPGLSECLNSQCGQNNSVRLCRCPVFLKLCKREIADSHAVPVGVYYPLCIWKWHVARTKGISIRDEPSLNNQQFQELVRNGLIGSTPKQSIAIERHLVNGSNDNRMKLIFRETTANS